jgi:5'-3' exonuclease
MKALIDGDLVAFINASSAIGDPLWVATSRADRFIRDILQATGCNEYEIYLSGGKNFRYEINPEYKAHRKKEDEPEHRDATEAFLIKEWGAIRTDGYEADDALGCAQTDDTIICSIDKDLRMVGGKHYSWTIIRKGKIVREPRIDEVSDLNGLRHFYKQMLIGDSSDNLFGVEGVGGKTADKLIDPLTEEADMRANVLLLYTYGYGKKTVEEPKEGAAERFKMNADCLWIWRQLGETFSVREEIRGTT